MSNGRILLRERANTGYGDGAYQPPTGQLADRETIVETAIRVASAEAGITISAGNVSLAHVIATNNPRLHDLFLPQTQDGAAVSVVVRLIYPPDDVGGYNNCRRHWHPAHTSPVVFG